jgi:uncharacterized protein YkwD
MCALVLFVTGCGPAPVVPEAKDDGYRALAREVFAETNRLRADPPAYGRVLEDILVRISGNIYQPQRAETGIRLKEGKSAVREAIAVIGKTAPLPRLQWSEALAQLARAHVADTGPWGVVSHESRGGKTLAERLMPVMRQERFSGVAENIAYGHDIARDVMAHLFIDDGVPGRGHRHNLLQQRLNYSGVACGYHKRYRHMCVAIYAYRAE